MLTSYGKQYSIIPQYIKSKHLESLPWPALTRPLLKKFKTIKKIINAKQEKLEKVEKIGPKKAAEIKKVTESEYEG